jgi:hypothetical protein
LLLGSTAPPFLTAGSSPGRQVRTVIVNIRKTFDHGIATSTENATIRASHSVTQERNTLETKG